MTYAPSRPRSNSVYRPAVAPRFYVLHLGAGAKASGVALSDVQLYIFVSARRNRGVADRAGLFARGFCSAAGVSALGSGGGANASGRGVPALKKPRHYHFKGKSYLLGTGTGEVPVAYNEVTQLLSSRRALYLLRRDGSADILPKDALPEGLELFLTEKLTVERSSFL